MESEVDWKHLSSFPFNISSQKGLVHDLRMCCNNQDGCYSRWVSSILFNPGAVANAKRSKTGLTNAESINNIYPQVIQPMSKEKLSFMKYYK